MFDSLAFLPTMHMRRVQYQSILLRISLQNLMKFTGVLPSVSVSCASRFIDILSPLMSRQSRSRDGDLWRSIVAPSILSFLRFMMDPSQKLFRMMLSQDEFQTLFDVLLIFLDQITRSGGNVSELRRAPHCTRGRCVFCDVPRVGARPLRSDLKHFEAYQR